MIEYTVKVNEFGNKFWYLNGKSYSEEEFNDIITIDSVQYKKV